MISRQAKRNTFVRSRFKSLSANERVKLRSLKRSIIIAHIHVIAAKSEAEEKEAIDIMNEYMFSYIGIKFNEKIRLDRPIRIAWKIECLDDTFCEQFLRE